MASLCALIFFWQALFVHGKPIFSARQVTKNAKKIPVRKQLELNPRQQFWRSGYLPLDHHLVLPYYCSGTMYRPRDENFF